MNLKKCMYQNVLERIREPFKKENFDLKMKKDFTFPFTSTFM